MKGCYTVVKSKGGTRHLALLFGSAKTLCERRWTGHTVTRENATCEECGIAMLALIRGAKVIP